MVCGFTYTPGYTLTPGQPPPGLDYLPASPHHLPTTTSGHRLHHSPSLRRDQRRLHGLSIRGFDTGRFKAGTGISTGCPSTTPVGLALGPDLPWADQLDPGTLSQSAQTFLTFVSLLMPAFSLVNRPPLASTAASPGTRRSPTHHSGRWPSCCNDTTSAVRLSPATLSARNHLTSELLRTLSRVAASKPTSWLSLRLHILSHLAYA
jgi:hypothetical protein